MSELTILWLDDQRDPYRYLNTKSKSATFARNKQFYDNLLNQYNANFVWVKNLYQFIDYIEKNGVPQFVSFDHDLNNRGGGEGLSDEQKLNNNGVNAAKWLVNYCRKNKQPLPKFYVHSANPKHGPEINKVLDAGLGENRINKKIIRITESDLHSIIKESVNIVLNEIENYAQNARNLEDEEYKDLCEKIYPFKKYLSEISQFGEIKNKGIYYDIYDENINSFISEYKITDFYDDWGDFDEEKLENYLNDYFESDIYSED